MPDVDLDSILQLILAGWQYSEIAVHLGMTKKMVKDRAAKLRVQGHRFHAVRGRAVINGSKVCVKCNQPKPLSEFYAKTVHYTNTSSWCRSCTRLGSQINRYGVSEEAVRALPISSTCPLCNQPYTDTRIPVIDHDHESGKLRGIICFLCNHALGRIEDRPDTALNIHNYLKLHGGPSER